MKVLLVDDAEDIRLIASMCLRDPGGMETLEAADAAEGFRLALTKPDVVLLDVMLPGTDGPTLLAQLRANPETADIPVIFLTAKTMPSERSRLIELGAKGVIAKPFDPLTLGRQIRQMLAE